MRDTPPDLSGVAGTNQVYEPPDDQEMDETFALRISRATLQASTSYLTASVQKSWETNIQLFQSRHPAGSKYYSDDYKGRSRLFRPKPRMSTRKAEAAVVQAFFSTQDVVAISAQDQDDEMQIASAALWHRVMNLRLTSAKGVPFFTTTVMAFQDSTVYGLCCSKQYWSYKKKVIGFQRQPKLDPFGMPVMDANGQFATERVPIYKVIEDRPKIHLFPPENFRVDPAADPTDPVNTSPYLIAEYPMFAGDVRAMTEVIDDKTGQPKWRAFENSALWKAKTDIDNVEGIDQTRHGNTQRPREAERTVGDTEVVWVREYVYRHRGQDFVWMTLGSEALLTKPTPLEEVYRHGIRPFQIGYIVLESHKVYPESKVGMIRDLAVEANDLANLSLDVQKLASNPKAMVRAGANVSMPAVRRHWPGEVVVVNDVEQDVKWEKPPEPSAATYIREDRIAVDMDEMSGVFSQGTVQSSRHLNETVGGMQMLGAAAGQIGEYDMRVFSETWVEPVLRQLLLLEQYYETDMTILALAGKKAKLVQRFGIDQLTDELLSQELTVTVNVGVGATDPAQRLQRFLFALDAFGKVIAGAVKLFGPQAAVSRAVVEVGKEIFGLSGYKDGERFMDFFTPSEDVKMADGQMPNPNAGVQLEQAQMIIQQLQQQLQQALMQVQDKSEDRRIELLKAKADFDLRTQELTTTTALKERQMLIDAELEREKMANDVAVERERGAINAAMKREDGDRQALQRREEGQQQMALRREENAQQIALKREQGDLDRQARDKPSTVVKTKFDAQDAMNALVKTMAGFGEETKKLGEAIAKAMEEASKRQGEQAEALARAADAMVEGNKASADALARASESMEDSALQISEAVRVLAMPKTVTLDNGRTGTIAPTGRA